jgi:CheY-like chemotaxis protein
MSELTEFKGRRVLVVEDEMMIAMLVEDMLADLGCSVVGPAHALHEALALANTDQSLDAALLDVNLAGTPVYEVADALRAIGVPAIFSTGYGASELRPVDQGSPVLQKPFRATDLARALGQVLGVS